MVALPVLSARGAHREAVPAVLSHPSAFTQCLHPLGIACLMRSGITVPGSEAGSAVTPLPDPRVWFQCQVAAVRLQVMGNSACPHRSHHHRKTDHHAELGVTAYGGELSAILAALFALFALFARQSALPVLVGVAGGAFAGPVAWNAILRATAANQFFVDAPIPVFPISWQDTGSRVFALATLALILGSGLLRTESGGRLSVLGALAALIVDIYLYRDKRRAERTASCPSCRSLATRGRDNAASGAPIRFAVLSFRSSRSST